MAQAPNYATYYQQVEVKTADKFELILILYKGAISQLNQAKGHLQKGEVEARVRCLNKAVAMIGELQAALDFEKGKEIATSLNRLYSYMLHALAQANLKQDAGKIDEVVKLLQILKSAWDEIREQSRPSTQPSTPPPQAGQHVPRAFVG